MCSFNECGRGTLCGCGSRQLAQLVVCRRRSWELTSSIPAMVDFADIVATGFTQTIAKGTWLKELNYVNDVCSLGS